MRDLVGLRVAEAHVAIRSEGAKIDPRSDRALRFHGQTAITVPAHSQVTSDPVELSVPALTDLAVSIFLPSKVDATTSHLLALQTSYVAEGNSTGSAELKISKTIDTWPFLTGVDVSDAAPLSAVAIIGSSTTDGDGSTQDENRRWPDDLARRLQQAGGQASRIGVLNAGIIGNRLLKDSPQEVTPKLHGSRVSTFWNPHANHGGGGSDESPFGAGLGEAVLSRLDRDALDPAGVRYLVVAIGINDICFPGAFTPPADTVTAEDVINGYKQIIHRAHKKGIRVLMTTIPPFENAIYTPDKTLVSYTLEKEAVRKQVNEWIRSTTEPDGVADFDAVLRDPAQASKLQVRFDAGDHIHANDAGYAASTESLPLTFFASR